VNDLAFISEPTLEFALGQELEDPRDGLRLFGPLDKAPVHGIRWSVIGTPAGIVRFKRWVKSLQTPIVPFVEETENLFRPPYPGFEAAYGVPFPENPVSEIEIDEKRLSCLVRCEDRHQRVYDAVDLFSAQIVENVQEYETRSDIWFVVVPDEVHKYCRPESTVEYANRVASSRQISYKLARKIANAPSFFEELNQAAKPYEYEPNFHNQLKARLLAFTIPTQIIRESTIAPNDFLNQFGYPKRKVDNPSTIAWNISNATFYKAGGRPWKLATVRPGVCYLGLVFKRDDRTGDARNACCAAQMFLDSGDGVVFRGAVGPWYSPEDRSFHLGYQAARDLVDLAIRTYKKTSVANSEPAELFIHGKISLDEEEWAGMSDAAGTSTNVVGVKIRKATGLKLYTKGIYPVLRGVAYVDRPLSANLWTVGFTPRLQTYLGKESPNPLAVEVCRGKADLKTVLSDIMALTKLNYNACIFADGQPVTLRFADAVGEILTAGPLLDKSPLPFKYYI